MVIGLKRGAHYNIRITKRKLTALKSSHSSDAQAVSISGKITYLDYQLGVDSDKAYTQYNKSLVKLERNAAKQRVDSKTKQREDALDMYHSNLNESNAQDPNQLNQDNEKRLNDLDELYATTIQKIKKNILISPEAVTEYIEVNKSPEW
ncbi:hypothetical protein DA798_05385 [Lactobacillus sp. PFC-70]|nr:hypothetical protein DA798_05385 [Lactobacillus sp. PFC-70]